MHKLTVSFIVHDDFSQVHQALSSLYSNTTLPFKVCLTINSGPTRQVDEIRKTYPDMSILVNDKPRGFAANHNTVMRLAQTPFVALLNDDIFLHPKALDLL